MTSTLLHTSVLDAIGADIVSASLAPGSVITLDQLQARYGASRGPVRECMRVLEMMGMLKSQRRTGITVQPSACWNANDALLIRWRLEGPGREKQLQSLTELRLGIEPVAARLAAMRATVAERDELRDTAAIMRANGEADRHDRHLEADVRFHTKILEATHNEMYIAQCDVVREVLTARRRQENIDHEHVIASLARHEAVMNAIIRGDEDEAESAMHALLAEVRNSVAEHG